MRPGLEAQSWTTAALYGLALGLVGYGVYDLTNAATLRTWPLALTLGTGPGVLSGNGAPAGSIAMI